MNKQNTVNIIGAASGVAANDPGCCLGPVMMQGADCMDKLPFPIVWQDMLYARDSKSGLEAIPAVAELNENLAQLTYQHCVNQQNFTVIGGDHSCAIGTWSGVAAAMRKQGPIGLIWIDAHMDAHTPDSSDTGNVHGMPVSSLLGYGDPSLTGIIDQDAKILPNNLCLIGIRSYEEGEAALLKSENVRIFYMDEVIERGFASVFEEALKIVTTATCGFGISIDLDGIDPEDAPGVGCREKNGIHSAELLTALASMDNNQPLLGLEITEYNPQLDQDKKTEALICELIQSVFNKS